MSEHGPDYDVNPDEVFYEESAFDVAQDEAEAEAGAQTRMAEEIEFGEGLEEPDM
jgi:hypothetical protein